jgi:NitT/TauT family transport system ATP-binding protein
MNLCELRGVQMRFPGPKGQVKRVLEDINLAVRVDEVLCVLGPNGVGKSTLLRVLSGLVQPTKGEVRWHGERLRGVNLSVSMVFQTFALVPWMNVEENVRMVLRAREIPEDEVRTKAADAIQKVGLEGFEEAFPRELSRGTKQRVGVARALAVDPEILVMDDPFSQVDALTGEALRQEILDIWSDADNNPSSIVLVSHSITEAVLMADRIAILGGTPGTVRTVVDNPLPRPRDPRSPGFLRLVDQLHDIIASSELPDVQVTASKPELAEDVIEPLPHANPSDILGLLEFLDTQQGGSCDLFQVVTHTHVPFEDVLTIVKGAEMLELVDTPRRAVVLTGLGKRFVASDMDARKETWKRQLLELRLFRVVRDLIEYHEGELKKDELVHELAVRLPMENLEQTFGTLVAWGRFGELFAYREDRGVLTPE